MSLRRYEPITRESDAFGDFFTAAVPFPTESLFVTQAKGAAIADIAQDAPIQDSAEAHYGHIQPRRIK